MAGYNYSSRSWKQCSCVVQCRMTTTDLKNLLERAQAWPEEAQDELVAVANQIESELQGQDYLATREELGIIDAAMASIDCVARHERQRHAGPAVPHVATLMAGYGSQRRACRIAISTGE
jgi:glutathione S-transferase